MVDCRERGDLFGAGPREFFVTPGRHEVRAYLGGGAVVEAVVSVGAGEVVSLHCGFRAGTPEQRRAGRQMMLAILSSYLADGAALLLFPFYRELAAELALRIDPEGPIARLVFLTMRSRAGLAVLAFLMFALLSRASWRRRWRHIGLRRVAYLHAETDPPAGPSRAAEGFPR